MNSPLRVPTSSSVRDTLPHLLQTTGSISHQTPAAAETHRCPALFQPGHLRSERRRRSRGHELPHDPIAVRVNGNRVDADCCKRCGASTPAMRNASVDARLKPFATQGFKTCAVWQPHARSVRLRRRSVSRLRLPAGPRGAPCPTFGMWGDAARDRSEPSHNVADCGADVARAERRARRKELSPGPFRSLIGW